MIYDKDDIIKCYIYLNLNNTDNCSCFFNFISKKKCDIKESKSRNLIFQILKQSKIVERLDVFDSFWSQFEIRDENVGFTKQKILTTRIFTRLQSTQKGVSKE